MSVVRVSANVTTIEFIELPKFIDTTTTKPLKCGLRTSNWFLFEARNKTFIQSRISIKSYSHSAEFYSSVYVKTKTI